MTSNTLGPWRVLPEERDKPYIRIRGTRLGGRYKIANVISPNYEGVLAIEAIETSANARLIAAAPDLLAALQEALQTLEYIYRAHPETSGRMKASEDIDRARAAVAKATA